MKLFSILTISLTFLLSTTDAKRFLIKAYGDVPDGAEIITKYGNKTIALVDCNQTVADDLMNIPTVDQVEEDEEVFLEPIREEYEVVTLPRGLAEQDDLHPGLWGLDQLDHRVDGKYTFDNNGKGVVVYVIDSGVNRHAEFKLGSKSRVVRGKAFGGLGDWKDCNGHGTHVASTIAGKTFGVAKRANIVSVRVFGCRGGTSWSNIVDSIYWVIRQKKKGIVNMSLGGSRSTIINEAVKDLYDAGFLPVVAAGNSGANACFYSPASAAEAVTVGCMSRSNTQCSFSNDGSCVDVFAPGLSIYGADIPTGGRYLSGTSMSSPHVAGIAALLKGKNKKWGVEKLTSEILRLSAENTLLLRKPESPNLSARIDNGRTSSPVTPFPTQFPTPFPTDVPEKPVKCSKKKFAKCRSSDSCKWVKKTGCRNNGWCGYKNSQACTDDPVCIWAGRCLKRP